MGILLGLVTGAELVQRQIHHQSALWCVDSSCCLDVGSYIGCGMSVSGSSGSLRFWGQLS